VREAGGTTPTGRWNVKIGVVGKGGVGKTTVAALLAEAFVRRGRHVLAVDTDSNPNLGVSLGLSPEDTESVPVLPRAVVVGDRRDTTPAELVAA
jgi:CO dehydrogenase maturation factor